MKKLLNTLYVTSPDSYLSLDGETVVVLNQDKVLGRVPLHNLEGIWLYRSKSGIDGRMCKP